VDKEDVGARIKYWREKAGLSQSALARAVKVDPSAVSSWESAKYWPTMRHVSMVADVCKVNTQDFWAPWSKLALRRAGCP